MNCSAILSGSPTTSHPTVERTDDLRATPSPAPACASSHWSPPPGTSTCGTPASIDFASIPWPPPQITSAALRQQLVLPPVPGDAPRSGSSSTCGATPETTARTGMPQHLPGPAPQSPISIMPADPGGRGGRRDDHQRRVPRRPVEDLVGGFPQQRPDHLRARRPVRARHLQRGQRGDQPGGRARGPGGRPIPTRASLRWTRPCRIDRAVAARISASRRRRRHRCPAPARPDGRQSLRGPVQRVRRELDPRHPEPFGSHAAADGDDVGHHEIGRDVTHVGQQRRRDVRRPTVDLRSGVGVVVELARRETTELARLDPDATCDVEPPSRGEEHRIVARGNEFPTQRQGRDGMTGLWSGDNSYSHPLRVPHRRPAAARSAIPRCAGFGRAPAVSHERAVRGCDRPVRRCPAGGRWGPG